MSTSGRVECEIYKKLRFVSSYDRIVQDADHRAWVNGVKDKRWVYLTEDIVRLASQTLKEKT